MPDTTTTTFERQLLLGRHPDGKVWVKVEWDGTRLSLTGEIGPTPSGNASGGCGQIDDELAAIDEFAAGWDADLVARLAGTWRRWHLNDMRAGCEHQRAAGWHERPIDPAKPTTSYGRHFPGQSQDSWNLLGWVRPDEHPDGLLGKPCDECGYRYGTAWLTEAVPADVIERLAALPATEQTHPWQAGR